MCFNSEKSNNYQQKLMFYKNYHKNYINVLVHTLCIPSIVWSIFGLANIFGKHIGIPQLLYYKFMPSILIYTIYMIYYYIIAPRKIFWSTLYFYYAILIESNRSYSININYNIYIYVHILGWIIQIMSHKVFEGNSPALFDGIIQSLTTAPIFIVQELKQIIPYIDIGVVSILYLLYRYRILYS